MPQCYFNQDRWFLPRYNREYPNLVAVSCVSLSLGAGDGSVEGAGADGHQVASRERGSAGAHPPARGLVQLQPPSPAVADGLCRGDGGETSARTGNEKTGKWEELSPNISTLTVAAETCK